MHSFIDTIPLASLTFNTRAVLSEVFDGISLSFGSSKNYSAALSIGDSVNWNEGRRCAGDFLQPPIAADQQANNLPLVLLREVGVLDERAPAAFDLAQPLREDFETALSFQEQSALALEHARACRFASSASMQARNSGSIGSVLRLTRFMRASAARLWRRVLRRGLDTPRSRRTIP
jgi:hypothetical protein